MPSCAQGPCTHPGILDTGARSGPTAVGMRQAALIQVPERPLAAHLGAQSRAVDPAGGPGH